MKRLVSRVLVAALALGLMGGVAGIAQAATKTHKVHCEVTTNGKKETKVVASAEECTKMGGMVVKAPVHHKKAAPKKSTTPAPAPKE
jgi:hypothetical protein